MRKAKQPDFWRPAWARRVADLAEQGLPPDTWETDPLNIANWENALDEARAGDWDWLDEWIERASYDDSHAPPPQLWPVLDAFFADPPNRHRGQKPRIDSTMAEAIRYKFHAITAPRQIVAGGLVIWTYPPTMTKKAAFDALASDHNVSWETIRDIVARRKTYSRDD